MNTSQMELTIDSTLPVMTANFARAIRALRDGKIVLLLDANDRENEGDLIVAAEKITPESMNFLIKKGSGVVCLAMPKARLDKLSLPLMIPDNTNFFQTAFTVSIEASHGVTTGVSAKDRAHTILVAIADDAESSDLARPGHVFPLAAQKSGVFDRMGHTEGSVDLMRIAGLKPGAVLCELMNEDGSMTIGEDRIKFANDFNIPVVTVEEVLFYRFQKEDIFKKSIKEIPSRFGMLTWQSFCFFDCLVVDVFFKSDFDPGANKLTKLAVVPGDNLPKRFLAQVLDHNEDDALVSALSKISQRTSDLTMMCSGQINFYKKTPQELRLLKTAAMCRVLKELAITKIEYPFGDSEMAHIAHNYFSINLANGVPQ
jgi:3,4-dihydroxy-2-butanone 4-phosphate synthase